MGKASTKKYVSTLLELLSQPEIATCIKEEFFNPDTLNEFLSTTYSVRPTLTKDDSYLEITVNKHSGYAFVTLPCNKIKMGTSALASYMQILTRIAQYNDIIQSINGY
jgi:hypothetical protein